MDEFRTVHSLADAASLKPHVAFITSPSSHHLEAALSLARAGVHLFIEKPISNTTNGLDELARLRDEAGIVIAVGYNFRFYTPLRALRAAAHAGDVGRLITIRASVGRYLPYWRPGRCYEETTTAHRDLGGGVLLELSHEIDYVMWIAGPVRTVTARLARRGDLAVDVEDDADIWLEMASGAVASIHLDMIDWLPQRECRIVGTGGTAIWDGLAHHTQLHSSKGFTDLCAADPAYYDAMYVAEMEEFLSCVVEGRRPTVSLEEGLATVAVVEAAQQSSQSGEPVRLIA